VSSIDTLWLPATRELPLTLESDTRVWRCDVGAGFINLDVLKPRCGTIVAHVGPPFSVGYKVDGKEYSDAEVVAEMCGTLQVRDRSLWPWEPME